MMGRILSLTLVSCFALALVIPRGASAENLLPYLPGALPPGDCNANGNVDISDGVCLLGYLFLGSPAALPCSDGTPEGDGNIPLLDWNGNGGLDLSDAVALLGFLFLGAPPHPHGEACRAFEACPVACPAAVELPGPIPIWPPLHSLHPVGSVQFVWEAPPSEDPERMTYTLFVWEARPGEALARILDRDPDVSVTDIPATAFDPAGNIPLLAGNTFAWRVDAVTEGIARAGEPSYFTVAESNKVSDITGLLDKLNELRKQLEKANDDLEGNPFVEEVRAIHSGLALLEKVLSGTLDDAALEALRGLANCDFTKLDDVPLDTIKSLLEVLEQFARFLAATADNPTEKKALEKIADHIKRVKAGADAIDNLQALKEHLKKLKEVEDFSKYLDWAAEGAAKDAIQKAIEKRLAKLVGEKAAGAIVSILSDLKSFFDLIIALREKEKALKAWNAMLGEVVCKAAECGQNLNDFRHYDGCVTLNPAVFAETDTVKLCPRLLCWKQEPGKEPGCGEWVECADSVAIQTPDRACDNSTRPQFCVEVKVADMQKVMEKGKLLHYKHNFRLCFPQTLCGDGTSCLLALEVTRGAESFGGLFVGTFKVGGADQ